MSRARLDDELVRRGLYRTRSRAREAILRGAVSVDGAAASKPAQSVGGQTRIDINDAAHDHVSRAALKLQAGIGIFGFSPDALNCLDIGASTGGFTQVLLEHGAAHVTAIDVGHGQMDPRIAGDRRVTSIEGLNARDLERAHLAHPISFIVSDVSFISLKLALPPALALAEGGAKLIGLIKPQFEVGRDGDPKDPSQQQKACAGISSFLSAGRWTVQGVTPSPIQGGDGSEEFLIGAAKL